MLTLKGLDSYVKKLRESKTVIDKGLTNAYKAFVAEVFMDIVRNTPQYTGDTAANWYIVHGPWDSKYRKWKMKDKLAVGDKRYRGHEEAVQWAHDRNMLRLNAVRWNTKIKIANETPIVSALENQSVYVRPVNLVNGQVQMIHYAKAKYSARIAKL